MSATNASRSYRKFKRSVNAILKRNGARFRASASFGDVDASKFVRGVARKVSDQIRGESNV